jgi:chloramphenicol O-acetyltransferase
MTFYYWGKYTKKEGELVLSLCSRSKGAASLTHFCQKTKKRDERKKRDHKERRKGETRFDRGVTVAEKV